MNDEVQPSPENPEQEIASSVAPETTPDDATSSEIQALQEEIAALRDQLLREQAETQNVRRRAEREVDQARKFALERFATELLPVVDNLERALAAVDGADESLMPILEGVGLTHRQFGDVLRRFHIDVVDPKGQTFDPQYHEAVASVPSPDAEPNTVIDVMQKGYTLNGRVLRAAMVVVAAGN